MKKLSIIFSVFFLLIFSIFLNTVDRQPKMAKFLCPLLPLVWMKSDFSQNFMNIMQEMKIFFLLAKFAGLEGNFSDKNVEVILLTSDFEDFEIRWKFTKFYTFLV